MPQEPVVLELAPLPREQMGPFLILGVDKDADPEQIEAHWAQRVIWARKNQTPIPLTDINWARETIGDFDRRVRADAISLNVDTIGRVLGDLANRYGVGEPGGPVWQPVDVEKPLATYTPPVEVPDAQALLRQISVPELPWEMPAVTQFLEASAAQPIDPWKMIDQEF